eukprot:940967-Amphidinium_carterae.1
MQKLFLHRVRGLAKSWRFELALAKVICHDYRCHFPSLQESGKRCFCPTKSSHFFTNVDEMSELWRGFVHIARKLLHKCDKLVRCCPLQQPTA